MASGQKTASRRKALSLHPGCSRFIGVLGPARPHDYSPRRLGGSPMASSLVEKRRWERRKKSKTDPALFQRTPIRGRATDCSGFEKSRHLGGGLEANFQNSKRGGWGVANCAVADVVAGAPALSPRGRQRPSPFEQHDEWGRCERRPQARL